MKTKKVILFIALLFSCSATMVYAQVTKQYRLFSIDKNEIGNKIHIFFKLDSVQYQYQEGIKFSLRFKNTSVDSIKTANPLDLLSMGLLKGERADVLYPFVSRIKVHSRQKPSIKTAYGESYSIESVMLNGEPASLNLDSQTVTIPGGANLEIIFKITGVLKPDAVKPYNPSQKMKIPFDNYTFVISTSVTEGKTSATYNTKPIPVTYSQCKQ
jgi:hypothetical protein